MAAVVIDGKALAAKVKESVRAQVEQMERKPGLAVVLVGDDSASRVYVNGKKKDCGECGIYSEEYALPALQIWKNVYMTSLPKDSSLYFIPTANSSPRLSSAMWTT